MNSSIIAVSEAPEDCICAIFSLAGCEKPQPSMLQVATVSLQPHWQASLEPTRYASTFWLRPAICAIANEATQTARIASLLLHWNMLLGNPHNFSSRVLQFNLAGNQGDHRSENQHDSAGPNPA